GLGDAVAPIELREAAERMCHLFQLQREGEHAAAVDRGPDLVLRHLCRLGVRREHLPLDTVALEPVALASPAVRTAEGEHPGVLARAVVLEPGRRLSLAPALELVLA